LRNRGFSRTPSKQGQKRSSPKYMIVKTLNIQNKEKLLKPIRQKSEVRYKGKPIRLAADFTIETLKEHNETH
jgi:hypothetical protein